MSTLVLMPRGLHLIYPVRTVVKDRIRVTGVAKLSDPNWAKSTLIKDVGNMRVYFLMAKKFGRG